jgi:hypothetical protein
MLISIISLLSSPPRPHQARRLNLLIPGMPGYAAERERLILSVKGVNASTEPPEVWDVVDGRGAHRTVAGKMGWGEPNALVSFG